MFEQASRMKMRFQTSRGQLNVEDLWDLSLDALNSLAKSLKKELKNDEEDFLNEKSSKDTYIQLQFDVVFHILTTKKAEKEAQQNKAAKKAEKEMLLNILNKKQNAALENLSPEDLLKKINELED